MIKKALEMGKMEGISIFRGGGCPSVSHLFFANDSIIFDKVTIEEYDALQWILNVYENSSSDKIARKVLGAPLFNRAKQKEVI